MKGEFDILVIGGGIVGLTAALAMAQQGYSVAVIDAGSLEADTSLPDLRVYAINQASQSLLEQLGAWANIDQQRISPYRQMHVWDSVNGAHIDFDSRSIGVAFLGHIIEESVLKQALLQQIAQQPLISLFPHHCVKKIEEAEAQVSISSEQQSWQGRLLMIADGANSPARQQLNVELTSWSYQQHALVAMVEIEKAHQQTAYQVFNPDGPLAFLPLANSHQCSIVWSTSPERAQELLALPEEKFNQALTEAFAARLGQVKVLSKRHQFPLQMRHAKQYVGERWLLLGDAAHTIHPLAGLGLNIGLADVNAWICCMAKNNSGQLATKKILGTYQRERKHAVWQVIALMEGFKRLFSHAFSPIAILRGWGLSLCNQFTPLKRLFIQHASGKIDFP